MNLFLSRLVRMLYRDLYKFIMCVGLKRYPVVFLGISKVSAVFTALHMAALYWYNAHCNVHACIILLYAFCTVHCCIVPLYAFCTVYACIILLYHILYNNTNNNNNNNNNTSNVYFFIKRYSSKVVARGSVKRQCSGKAHYKSVKWKVVNMAVHTRITYKGLLNHMATRVNPVHTWINMSWDQIWNSPVSLQFYWNAEERFTEQGLPGWTPGLSRTSESWAP